MGNHEVCCVLLDRQGSKPAWYSFHLKVRYLTVRCMKVKVFLETSLRYEVFSLCCLARGIEPYRGTSRIPLK